MITAMIFIMVAASILSGSLAALLLWPAFGPAALLAAPIAASLVALMIATLAAVLPERSDTGAEPHSWLDAMADRLVAELRKLTRGAESPASEAERRRKLG